MAKKRKPMQNMTERMENEKRAMAALKARVAMDVLRLTLVQQCALLGVHAPKFLEAINSVGTLGLRVREIVEHIPTMSEKELSRNIAEITKALDLVRVALRLGKVAPAMERMGAGVIRAPGNERIH